MCVRESVCVRERERESVVQIKLFVQINNFLCCLNALAIQNVCFCHANKAF